MTKKRGRPTIEIDKSHFENLCKLQCTKTDIAGFFNCSEDTIERFCNKEYGENFAVVYKRCSSLGKISLRRYQWKSAENGNVTMQIWLGRQYLGQTDKVVIEGQEVETFEGIENALQNINQKLGSNNANN